MNKLSLCVIAKDQVQDCKNIIEKYKHIFNEILIAGDCRHEDFGALTGIWDNCVVSYFQYKWKNDFSDKRNFLASKVKTPYYFRIDTDDDIANAENIFELLDKAVKNDIDVVYLKYKYAHDKDGNCIAEHWRESLIRKRDGVSWKGSVHESIIFDNQETSNTVRDNTVTIVHNIDEEHVKESSRRNLEILLDEFKRDGEKCDPRTLGYIGRSFLGLGLWEQAFMFLDKFVKVSGWDEDIYYAYCQMSEALYRIEKYDTASVCAFNALRMFPQYPDAYLKLGQIYLDKKDFKRAIHWYEIGIQQEVPVTMIAIDPSYYGWVTQLNLAMCYLGAGDAERAWQLYSMASKVAPNAEGIKNSEKLFKDALVGNKFFFHLLSLGKMIENIDKSKMEHVARLIPDQFLIDERAHVIRNKCLPKETWDKDTVVIYCGSSFEDWSDPSVSLGIGGSEEAVIYASRELVKLGKKVVVYNQCGDLRGEWNGVEYRNWYEFNRGDKFDTIIFWRGIPFNVDGRNRIVWMHDVPCGTFNSTNKDWYDKVFVLSEFHKSLVEPYVSSDKIVVTRNGINLEDTSSAARTKNRCIYTSSYDRGLENLLDMWPDVRKEVPDAELHIFYGWNTYDKMVECGMRDGKYKEHLLKKLDQPGVFEHGRVGHQELAVEFAKSDYYLYPSWFDEISCISAMKAQAYGAIPITSDYAALKETVKYGFKIEGRACTPEFLDKYKTKLIDCLRNDLSPMRDVILKDQESWTWKKVAEEWMSVL